MREDMNNKVIISLVIILAALAGGMFFLLRQVSQPNPKPDSQQTVQTADEQEVRDLIAQFGDKMKAISLLAPKDSLIKEIEDNYGPLISSELLAGWKMHPEWAPGRLTSSPWPSRIAVLLLERGDDGSYEAQGKIMEMTSTEATNGSEIDSGQSVALKIRKQDGKWVVTGFTKAVPRQ